MKKILNFALIMFAAMAMSATCDGTEEIFEDFTDDNQEENVGGNGGSNNGGGSSNDSIGGGGNYGGNDSINYPNVNGKTKRLVRYVCEEEGATFSYDSKGRLKSAKDEEYDGSDYESDTYPYVWANGGVENVEDNLFYTLENGLIKRLTGGGSDDIGISFYYDGDNLPYKAEGGSAYGSIRFTLVWDGNKVTQMKEKESSTYGSEEVTFTFYYNSGKQGRGFVSTWENPINEELEDYLLMAHPELLGLQNWTALPDKMVCESDNAYDDSEEIYEFDYQLDNDGYIVTMKVRSTYTDSNGYNDEDFYVNRLYWE